jgi:hypothetical protein
MAGRFHSDHRSGTASYAHDRAVYLGKTERGYNLAAARSKSPVKRRANERKAASARKQIEALQQVERYRAELPPEQRQQFNLLRIKAQQVEIKAHPAALSLVEQLRVRLFRLFPNALKYEHPWQALDFMDDEAAAELMSLSDDDIAELIKKRKGADYIEALNEFLGQESAEIYSSNPLHYHGSRTIIGV